MYCKVYNLDKSVYCHDTTDQWWSWSCTNKGIPSSVLEMGSHLFSMREMTNDADEKAHRGLSESNLQ